MYIHKKYLINNESRDIKEYKTLLKKISRLNLRRSSKFNILAILGALNCVDKKNLSDNTGIYVSSEFASITSVKKVLDNNEKNSMIMPFDFLNINSNNVSFYVSQSLESNGKNMLLTSDELSFERAIELALFDIEIGEINDALIGLVDESLLSITDFSKYAVISDNTGCNDYSGWLYLNQDKENALCKISTVAAFSSLEKFDNLISTFDSNQIYANKNAKKYLDLKSKNKLDITISTTIESIIDFLDKDYKEMIYISMDSRSKGYLFHIIKG
ncbi:hypothetical protein OAR97_00185 [Arcobacteraceae bacterium]|nr:hypothetical protein [Arcobacteraceae bacterium]